MLRILKSVWDGVEEKIEKEAVNVEKELSVKGWEIDTYIEHIGKPTYTHNVFLHCTKIGCEEMGKDTKKFLMGGRKITKKTPSSEMELMLHKSKGRLGIKSLDD